MSQLERAAERLPSVGAAVIAAQGSAQIGERLDVREPRGVFSAFLDRLFEQFEAFLPALGQTEDAQIPDDHARHPAAARELQFLLCQPRSRCRLAKREVSQCGRGAPGKDARTDVSAAKQASTA